MEKRLSYLQAAPVESAWTGGRCLDSSSRRAPCSAILSSSASHLHPYSFGIVAGEKEETGKLAAKWCGSVVPGSHLRSCLALMYQIRSLWLPHMHHDQSNYHKESCFVLSDLFRNSKNGTSYSQKVNHKDLIG